MRTVVALNAPLDVAAGWMFDVAARRAAATTSATSSGPGCSTFRRARSARTYRPGPDGSARCARGSRCVPARRARRRPVRATGRPRRRVGQRDERRARSRHGRRDTVGGVAGRCAFSTLGRAGRVEEVRSGALARADTMFACSPRPRRDDLVLSLAAMVAAPERASRTRHLASRSGYLAEQRASSSPLVALARRRGTRRRPPGRSPLRADRRGLQVDAREPETGGLELARVSASSADPTRAG